MQLAKHLRRAVAYALRDRVALAINIGNGIALLLLVAVGLVHDLNLTWWILGWLLISGLSNLLMAWNNERRQAAGHEPAWNEIVGRSVIVCRRFEPRARHYRGTVQLGTERWQAVSRAPLTEGEAALVTGRNGLVLEVAPRADPDPAGVGG